jgi:cytochrome oxidase Cu insertion factor (SCO1/SenC/PrrC family)
VLAAPADSPQVFSEVAPFELVERSGKPVKREDLLGRPWVASFVFTRCSGPCPRVVGTLSKLQGRLRGGTARIVTISVDPSFDTPEVLREYAANVGADPARWWFLTGDEPAIQALIRGSFLSAVERAPEGTAPPGEAVSHRTQLVAIDKKGRVRGFYAGESDADLDLLVARLEHLAREPE